MSTRLPSGREVLKLRKGFSGNRGRVHGRCQNHLSLRLEGLEERGVLASVAEAFQWI